MSLHKQILDNLEGRVHGVNFFVVLHGIEDHAAGLEALHELIRGGRIRVEEHRVEGMVQKLYRKVYTGVSLSVVE